MEKKKPARRPARRKQPDPVPPPPWQPHAGVLVLAASLLALLVSFHAARERLTPSPRAGNASASLSEPSLGK